MSETKPSAGAQPLHRIVNAALRPHAPTIAVIGFTGNVAVVVHEPGETGRTKARALGWDGKDAVFQLTPEGKKTLSLSTAPSDAAVAKWLDRKFEPAAPVARIYVL